MKVVEYNIWDGGEGRLDVIADVLAGQEPDAVAVIEATSRPNAEQLARTLGMELSPWCSTSLRPPAGSRTSSSATSTR